MMCDLINTSNRVFASKIGTALAIVVSCAEANQLTESGTHGRFDTRSVRLPSKPHSITSSLVLYSFSAEGRRLCWPELLVRSPSQY